MGKHFIIIIIIFFFYFKCVLLQRWHISAVPTLSPPGGECAGEGRGGEGAGPVVMVKHSPRGQEREQEHRTAPHRTRLSVTAAETCSGAAADSQLTSTGKTRRHFPRTRVAALSQLASCRVTARRRRSGWLTWTPPRRRLRALAAKEANARLR